MLRLRVAALALASCAPTPREQVAPAQHATAASAPTAPQRRLRGDAPRAPLVAVALSPDGEAAVTVDRLAHGLLWPALDGSLEPQRLPGAVSRAAILRTSGWFAACIVDSAGGATFLRLDATGVDVAPARELPPSEHIVDALAIGENFVLRQASGAVALFDAHGRERDRYEARGFPIDTVLAAGDRAVLAGVTREAPSGRVIAMRWLAITDEGLRRDRGLGDIQVATPSLSAHALVADRERLAYIAAENNIVFIDGDPEDRLGSVAVVDLSSGERTELQANVEGETRLILRAGKLYLARLDSGSVWPVRGDPAPHPLVTVAGSTLRARGSTLAGVRGGDLLIQRDDRYYALGYDQMLAGTSALSPDGTRFLLADGDSYVIEPIAGEDPTVVLDDPGEQPPVHRAAFVGDSRLLLLHATGWLRLLDWRTGEQLWSASTGIAYDRMEVSPDGEFLFLSIDDTLEGYRLREDGRLFLDMGVQVRDWGQLNPARTGGDLLWTVDHARGLRRYAAEDIARDAPEPDAIAVPDGLVAVDAAGRTYLAARDGASLLVTDDEETRRIALPESAIPSRAQLDDRSGVIVYRADDGVVLAADGDTGELRWSRRFPPATTLEVGAGRLLARGLEGAQLIDLHSGAALWDRCVGAFRRRPIGDEPSAGTAGDMCR